MEVERRSSRSEGGRSLAAATSAGPGETPSLHCTIPVKPILLSLSLSLSLSKRNTAREALSKMSLFSWFLRLSVALVTVLCTARQALDLPEMSTTCGTLPSTIHVTKEEYDDAGKVVRSCEGMVAVNKCEGTCISQVQPSVITPTGFLKDCQCCRESWMRQREVKLIECYDADGQKLKDKEGIMIIQMQEPEECVCHRCGT